MKRCKDCVWLVFRTCDHPLRIPFDYSMPPKDIAIECFNNDKKYYERKAWKFWRPK